MANKKKTTRAQEPLSDVDVVVDPNSNDDHIQSETRQAFMGLAISNFATNDDLGRGPSLTLRAINNRQMSKKRLEKFICAVGGDPLDLTKPLTQLHRFDPTHAIVVLVERRFVDIDALLMNPLDVRDLDTLPHVVWEDKENFSLSKGTVANGNGRIDFCRTILVPKLIEERHQLESAIATQPADKVVLAKLKKELQRVNRKLEEPASWLVAFYDLELIQQSAYARQIKLGLASNTPIYQVPDDEDEALNLILNAIGDLSKDEQVTNLKKHAKRLSSGPKRLAPVINNIPMMLQVVDLYRYSKYWPAKGFCTNQLYDWRTGVSPFFEAIVYQGIAFLDYLTSDITPPRRDNWTIPGMVPDALDPQEDILDADFFTVVSDCYVKHLFPCREAYGIPSQFLEAGKPLYSSAYANYSQDVLIAVGTWCEERSKAVQDVPKHAHIVATLPKRLAYALHVGLFNCVLYGLELPTPPPVLCKFFVIDTCDYLAKYRYPIMEIYRMLEPLYCSILVDARRETIFKDRPTEMFRAWVEKLQPRLPICMIINRCCSIIFQHRATALLKIVAEDLGHQPRYPPRATLYTNKVPGENTSRKKEAPIWARQYELMVSLMKKWRSNGVEGTGLKSLSEYPRPDYRPEYLISELQKLEHGPMLLRMLEATSTHWAAFSASQMTGHARTIVGYLLNSLWVYIHHGRRYLATNEVWALREELMECLEEELGGYNGLWDGIIEQVGGAKHPLSQTAGSVPRKLVLENVGKKMEGKMQEVVKHIAQQLVHRDLGAIPLEEGGLGLPKRVYRAAMILFKEVAVASWKAQTMYTDLKINRMAKVTSEQSDILFDRLPLPDVFKLASEGDTERYYNSLSPKDLDNIRVSGTGSEREQAKILRAQNQLRQRVNKVNRALGVSSAQVGLEHLISEGTQLEKIEDVEYDDESHPGYLIKKVQDTPPSTQRYEHHSSESEEEDEDVDKEEDEDEDEDKQEEEDEEDEEEEATPHNSDGEQSEHASDVEQEPDGGESESESESESDAESEKEEPSGYKRKRATSAATSSGSERTIQRRRLVSPEHYLLQATQAPPSVQTPMDADTTMSAPPDAPKGQKIGLVDDRTPESTFPKAPRGTTPEYVFEGYDDTTLVEMAAFADNLPSDLFKGAKGNGAEEVRWTSSPQAGPSSSTPPASTARRELRPRHHK